MAPTTNIHQMAVENPYGVKAVSDEDAALMRAYTPACVALIDGCQDTPEVRVLVVPQAIYTGFVSFYPSGVPSSPPADEFASLQPLVSIYLSCVALCYSWVSGREARGIDGAGRSSGKASVSPTASR